MRTAQLACCRRRPFLIRPLENTLIKLLKTLDFYDDAGREKLAIGACCSDTCQFVAISSLSDSHAWLSISPLSVSYAWPWLLMSLGSMLHQKSCTHLCICSLLLAVHAGIHADIETLCLPCSPSLHGTPRWMPVPMQFGAWSHLSCRQ